MKRQKGKTILKRIQHGLNLFRKKLTQINCVDADIILFFRLGIVKVHRKQPQIFKKNHYKIKENSILQHMFRVRCYQKFLVLREVFGCCMLQSGEHVAEGNKNKKTTCETKSIL